MQARGLKRERVWDLGVGVGKGSKHNKQQHSYPTYLVLAYLLLLLLVVVVVLLLSGLFFSDP